MEPTRTSSQLSDDLGAARQAAGRAMHSLVNSIQSRVVAGLVLALPIAVTFWILYQLYLTFRHFVLDPLAALFRTLVGKAAYESMPAWWDRFVAPVLAIGLVLFVLYVLGLFARSRLHRAVDWLLLHVPVVTTIYKTVSNVFQSLDGRGGAGGFKRVVLVTFPHPGSRALAFVTNTLRDIETGRPILAVCVLTGVVPPAGFTLFVPEDDVIEVGWSVNQTLQAIVSGGITAPPEILYWRNASAPIPKGSNP